MIISQLLVTQQRDHLYHFKFLVTKQKDRALGMALLILERQMIT